MAIKIYLYDNEFDGVGSGCLSASYIQWQLEAAQGQDVEVHISSCGGSAFDAVAIYNLLKNYAGNITTYIDSVAASAAATIAMAGQRRFISKYALLMIHKPAVNSGGTTDDLAADVQMLEAVEKNIVQIYTDVTGQPQAKIEALITATTWLTADEALELGFVTGIAPDVAGAPIKNLPLVTSYVKSAPKSKQQVFNKILTLKPMQDNADVLKANNTLLARVLNFFKKSATKITTNKGTKYLFGPLNEGTLVFNDPDMEDAADDDEVEATDKAGKKVIISLKDGKVDKVQKQDDDDDDTDAGTSSDNDDEDVDTDSKKVLNAHNISLKTKTTRKAVVNTLAGKLKEVSQASAAKDALIASLTAQLKVSNAAVSRSEHEVRNQIRSGFEPSNSRRSNKVKAEQPVPTFLQPQSDLARNAVKSTILNQKK